MSVSACSSLLPNRPSRLSHDNYESSSIDDESSHQFSSSRDVSTKSEPSSENRSSNNRSSSSVSSSIDDTSSYDVNDFAYEENYDGTLTISAGNLKNKENLGDVIIPEKYQGKKITAIADRGFSYLNSATSFTIPYYVKAIGNSAFSNCNELNTIYWNAENVEDNTSFNSSPFGDCSKLKRISFGSDVIRVPGTMFLRCESITDVEFMEGALEIGTNAFAVCSSLESINLPNSLRIIGDGVFQNCNALTEINIGSNVNSLGDNVFSGCSNLLSVSMPNSIENVGYSIFDGCTNLVFNEYGNGLYVGNSEDPYVFLYKTKSNSIDRLELPEGCVMIGDSAVARCQNLTSLVLNEGLKYIDRFAFENCSKLTKINLPSSIISLDEGFSYYCGSLEEINLDLPNRYFKIYNGSLYDFDMTTLIRHPNKSIYTSLTIPETVKTIGRYAFEGCSLIEKLVLPNGLEDLKEDTFTFCSSLNYHTYQNGYYIGSSTNDYLVFIKCDRNATNCEISPNCRFIHSHAFELNEKIVSVTIPDSVRVIGDMAFVAASNLETVTVSFGVTTIKYCAFQDCRKLKNFDLPDSVTTIEKYAFHMCESLTSLYIPIGLETIEPSVFSGCGSIKTVTIPNNIKQIKADAFSYCTSLESMVIGSGVESIENYVFYNCHALNSIFYYGSEANWGLISILNEGNYQLDDCIVYYYSGNQVSGGHYWHYVNDVPTIW